MRISLRRSARRAAAVLAVGTVLVSGAALTAGVLAVPVAGAATAAPPWEPVGGPQVGQLLFYNSTGQPITSGPVSTAPLAAYVEGTAVLNASDNKATLEAFTPVNGVPAGTWSGEQLSGSTVYPNTERAASVEHVDPASCHRVNRRSEPPHIRRELPQQRDRRLRRPLRPPALLEQPHHHHQLRLGGHQDHRNNLVSCLPDQHDRGHG